jgi:hypothetical protein
MLNSEMVAAGSLQVLFSFLFYDDNEWIIEVKKKLNSVACSPQANYTASVV